MADETSTYIYLYIYDLIYERIFRLLWYDENFYITILKV